jgi:hypothetical protein
MNGYNLNIIQRTKYIICEKAKQGENENWEKFVQA